MQGCSPDGGYQDPGGCALSPAELASPGASAACGARPSSQSPAGCELRVDCRERFDACQAFITEKGCGVSAATYSCYWRTDVSYGELGKGCAHLTLVGCDSC